MLIDYSIPLRLDHTNKAKHRALHISQGGMCEREKCTDSHMQYALDILK